MMKKLFTLVLTLVSLGASAASNVDSDTILENAKLLANSKQISKLIGGLRIAGWDYHGFVRDDSQCFGDCYKVELAFERWEYPEGQPSRHLNKVFTVSVDKASTNDPQIEIREGEHPFGTFLGGLNR